MKKLLVVAKNEILREAIKTAFQASKLSVIATDHKDALQKFFEEEPDLVIIFDYEERGGQDFFPGMLTYKDIKNSATKEKIFRAGFSSYNYEDYIKVPFDLKEVIEKIN